jgi:hypothetical protein
MITRIQLGNPPYCESWQEGRGDDDEGWWKTVTSILCTHVRIQYMETKGPPPHPHSHVPNTNT